MSVTSRDLLLEHYAKPDKKSKPEQSSFAAVFIATMLLFTGIAIMLKAKTPLPQTIQQKIDQIETRFVFEEKKVPVEIKKKKEPAPVKKTEPSAVKKPPVDLTKKPPVEQKPPEVSEPQAKEPPRDPVRKVYGLKKVYSSGIGSSTDASSAIIGKHGNTLDTEVDTFTATQQELKGEVSSIATVTTYPRLKKPVKPEYTKEMIEHRVEGVVRVKILIDIDGKVKKAVVLDDLGYGSKQKIYEACLKLEFEPAQIGGTPTAVWQLIKFRYELVN